MGQVSTKLRRYTGGYVHWCPGCERIHLLPDGWTFDGDVHAPTFSPSFKHSWGGGRCCHYILTAGRLNYCGDCSHPLCGQSVDLPDLPPDYHDFEDPCSS